MNRTSALLLGSLLLISCAHPSALRPPTVEAVPRQLPLHGDNRVDPYFWLRERSDPRVRAYLEEENAYTRTMMRHTEGLQERLYREMLERIQETDQSVPARDGTYQYYLRTEQGQQYPVHCRRKTDPSATEEILLDENALGRNQAFFDLGVLEVSPDQTLLAYSTDTEGSEAYILQFKDLRDGSLLPDRIGNTTNEAVWAGDNRTIFYTIQDEARRPFKVLRHVLGTDPGTDTLVFHETDEKFNLNLSLTRSRAYIVLSSESSSTREVRVIPADRPGEGPRVVQQRIPGVEYSLTHHGDWFYLVSNHQATNFKLVKAPLASPGLQNWIEVIPHNPDVKIESADAFRNHLVVTVRERGLSKIRVLDLGGGGAHDIAFPEADYTVWVGENREFDTRVLRVVYTSLVTPKSVFDYDMEAHRLELRKEQPVLGGYDRARYVAERIQAAAADGTSIPISLLYRRGQAKDGRSPMLLTGYGAYGSSYDPTFNSALLSLIDRGFGFAIAHVRGGGEMGRPWYDQGKLLYKKNTFTDFIACAEHLVRAGYTSPDRLAIRGGSAGGLLMGAVTTLRPDLFRAVVAHVPFVDVISTMLDPTIPLTTQEFEEWGDPRQKEYYDYMRSYSPYDNVTAKAYPHLLITAGLNDSRVQYWEPVKWVARLRATKTDGNTLLLKCEMGAGHFGPSGRYNLLRDLAFEYAFLLDRLAQDGEP